MKCGRCTSYSLEIRSRKALIQEKHRAWNPEAVRFWWICTCKEPCGWTSCLNILNYIFDIVCKYRISTSLPNVPAVPRPSKVRCFLRLVLLLLWLVTTLLWSSISDLQSVYLYDYRILYIYIYIWVCISLSNEATTNNGSARLPWLATNGSGADATRAVAGDSVVFIGGKWSAATAGCATWWLWKDLGNLGNDRWFLVVCSFKI